MTDLDGILREKNQLENLSRESRENKVPIVDYEVGRLLETMVFILKPESILEIGCGEGYSSYFLIKNSKNACFTGIDLNNKRMEKAMDFIKSNFPGVNSRFYSGNALKLLPQIEGKYDFVFIDAAKFEYPLYLEALIEKLEKNAVIVADNIFCDEKIFARFVKEHDKNSVEGIKKYIKMIKNKKIFDTRFIDLGDGVSISVFQQ